MDEFLTLSTLFEFSKLRAIGGGWGVGVGGAEKESGREEGERGGSI